MKENCFQHKAPLLLLLPKSQFYACLESVVADRIGKAAWLLSSGVAMCVDTCRFATWCCETHGHGCMNVAWALFWGGSRSTKPCVFLCKWLRPAMKGTSCVRRVRLGSFWFLLCVLQRVVVPVCGVLCVSWIFGCRSHWNGCMIVVIWCCHVCRYVQVCDVMLRNAL